MASLFADEDEAFVEAFADGDDPAPVSVEELSPRNNPDLLGHAHAEKKILADFTAGRMPHALVLAGLPGIGKATLAYRLARFLLSQGAEQGPSLFGDAVAPETLHLSPDHPAFRRVASGGHADLLTIDLEFDDKKGRLKTEISVEAVRRVHPFLRSTAAEGGWRVVIIDGAEYLNHSGQNALLKILEEPPAKSILILTTTRPGAFLPTIRSRVRMLNLDPLPENILGDLLDKMAPGIPPEQKSGLIRLSEGSIGRALAFQKGDGVALYKDILKAASTLPELDLLLVHELTEKIGRYGAEKTYELACEILSGWCGRLARHQARGQGIEDVLSGDAEIFQRMIQVSPPRHFMKTWDKMSQLFHQAEAYTLDRRQIILSAFLMLQKPEYAGPVA